MEIIGICMKNKLLTIYKKLPRSIQIFIKKNKEWFSKLYILFFTILGKLLLNSINKLKNKNKDKRFLEIGPGSKRIEGFETLNIVGGLNVDYVYDAAKPLPFKDNTFDLIYASHILEHIPWYQTEKVLREWLRILKTGGILEIWVPDGYKICKGLILAEEKNKNISNKDGWYRFNPLKDPYIWINGRIFTYGDGTGKARSPNWHRSIFTPKSLRKIMEQCNLKNIQRMSNNKVRGHDHGWISLGFKGTKK